MQLLLWLLTLFLLTSLPLSSLSLLPFLSLFFFLHLLSFLLIILHSILLFVSWWIFDYLFLSFFLFYPSISFPSHPFPFLSFPSIPIPSRVFAFLSIFFIFISFPFPFFSSLSYLHLSWPIFSTTFIFLPPSFPPFRLPSLQSKFEESLKVYEFLHPDFIYRKFVLILFKRIFEQSIECNICICFMISVIYELRGSQWVRVTGEETTPELDEERLSFLSHFFNTIFWHLFCMFLLSIPWCYFIYFCLSIDYLLCF